MLMAEHFAIPDVVSYVCPYFRFYRSGKETLLHYTLAGVSTRKAEKRSPNVRCIATASSSEQPLDEIVIDPFSTPSR